MLDYPLDERIPVAVLGATGSVGQMFLHLLDGHPWFKVVAISGSQRSAGRTYGEACHWLLPEPMPSWARDMVVRNSTPDQLLVKLAFSALPADEAREIEPALAQAGIWVLSNASAHRREPDVPILLPEVNPDHITLIDRQKARGWSGGIICNPNCTSTGLTVALKALQDAFSLVKVSAVSLQALSGAGYPGVASMDIIDNVIPYISGEEEKLEWEPLKMLGHYDPAAREVRLADALISAQVNRVAVTNGHLVCAAVELERRPTPQQAAEALAAYCPQPAAAGLPSSPHPAILVRSEPDRPQPRLDRDTGRGMTTVVGRIREDPLLHLKFVVLSHNTVRGAAGGAIYNAEWLVKRSGWV